MERIYKSFDITDTVRFKMQMLNWVNRFNICCFLDNHFYKSTHNSYECVAGAGVNKLFSPSEYFFSSLSEFYLQTEDWIFGHFNYDLKNRINQLVSDLPNQLKFPEVHLFVPEILFLLKGHKLIIGLFGASHDNVYNEIVNITLQAPETSPVHLKPRFTKEEYIHTIQNLRQHILRGDCYEINFCQEFFAEEVTINPIASFRKLNEESPNPQSAYYKLNNLYLVCASPERYIKKTGDRIISQPIKGTLKRDLQVEATLQRDLLYNNAKDRTENVMIVDLVRNDLSRICKAGTVVVDELFGIYTFPHLYQMISTVSGELRKEVDLSEILRATFPMGSMTGAPKIKVMELIEKYEKTRRGLYSGTLGYITPEKDFDFNVVIRSLMYNEAEGYLSTIAGGAITYNSDPESEYEESLLKLEAIKKVLQ